VDHTQVLNLDWPAQDGRTVSWRWDNCRDWLKCLEFAMKARYCVDISIRDVFIPTVLRDNTVTYVIVVPRCWTVCRRTCHGQYLSESLNIDVICGHSVYSRLILAQREIWMMPCHVKTLVMVGPAAVVSLLL